MDQRLTPATAALLMVPPLLWAGNAVVGRLVTDLVPPITLNFLRWALAFVLLLPVAGWVLRRDSGLWRHWKRYALLGRRRASGHRGTGFAGPLVAPPRGGDGRRPFRGERLDQ